MDTVPNERIKLWSARHVLVRELIDVVHFSEQRNKHTQTRQRKRRSADRPGLELVAGAVHVVHRGNEHNSARVGCPTDKRIGLPRFGHVAFGDCPGVQHLVVSLSQDDGARLRLADRIFRRSRGNARGQGRWPWAVVVSGAVWNFDLAGRNHAVQEIARNSAATNVRNAELSDTDPTGKDEHPLANQAFLLWLLWRVTCCLVRHCVSRFANLQICIQPEGTNQRKGHGHHEYDAPEIAADEVTTAGVRSNRFFAHRAGLSDRRNTSDAECRQQRGS